MALIECKKCHFEYDSSYRMCPMCEEDRQERHGKSIGKRVSEGRRKYSFVAALAITVSTAIIITLPFLIYSKSKENAQHVRNNNITNENSAVRDYSDKSHRV